MFLGIIGAALAAYLPALHGTLLWDDSSHVTAPALRGWDGLRQIWFSPGATQQYYPLLHSAFWLEHRLWGDAVIGYHLVNVLLHALAACLVVPIVRRLGRRGAWLAGLLFALHPLCVESVAWISEQKSTLSGALCLAAALAYLRFDDERRPSRYWTAFGLFVLALLAKTVTAMMPAALLAILWWRRGRVDLRRDARPLVPFFALGAAAGLVTAWVERTYIGAVGAEFALTPVERMLLAGRAAWFYFTKALWPAKLTFFYPRWQLDAADWTQYLFPAAAIALGVALWKISRASRGPFAAFLVFLALLFPALGFFDVYPFRYSFVADHFAYLALLAVVVPAAALLGRRRLSGAAGLLLAAALGLLTWSQAGDYRDAETLYRATIARNPDAWLAHNNLANLLLASGRRDEALAHLTDALRVEPDFWEAHLTLGNALAAMPGRLADAIAEFQTAARLAPEADRPHTNLGNALLDAGRTAEAADQLRIAIRLNPASVEAHNDLGNALSRTAGGLAEAIAEYRAALRADPDFAEAHNNLGRALAQSGRLPEGIAEFQTAIRLRPDNAGAHSNLGIALSQAGRLADAITEYRTAIRLRPESATAHNNLGFALAQTPGGLPAAIAEYREALRLDPSNAPARANLEAALRKEARR